MENMKSFVNDNKRIFIKKKCDRMNKYDKKQIEDIIRKSYLNGKLDIETEKIKWKGFILKAEPWQEVCFTKKEIRDAEKYSEDEDDQIHYLEDVAIENSEKYVEKEHWDGMVYFYPDEAQQPYGLTIFYKYNSRRIK